MDGLTERKRFDAWAAKHMTMDGHPAYTAWDAWQAAILAAARQPVDGLAAALNALSDLCDEAYGNGNSKEFIEAARSSVLQAILAAPRQPGEMGAGVQQDDPRMVALAAAEQQVNDAAARRRERAERLGLVAAQQDEREAHQLVDYTFDRPIGELHQEVGGVMVTLAALCLASGEDMHAAGETELARIWTKVDKIRAKQAAKPKHSPLPEHVAPAGESGIDVTKIPGYVSPRQTMETAVVHALGGKPVDPCDCMACVKMRGGQYGEESVADTQDDARDAALWRAHFELMKPETTQHQLRDYLQAVEKKAAAMSREQSGDKGGERG